MNFIKRIPHINNLSLKVISLVFGYFLWLLFSQQQHIITTTEIPVYITAKGANIALSTDVIHATIAGKKASLATSMKHRDMAVPLDASAYTQPGVYEITLYPRDILLREDIKLLHYTPSTLTLTIQ